VEAMAAMMVVMVVKCMVMVLYLSR
jgi:hypothetical protein